MTDPITERLLELARRGLRASLHTPGTSTRMWRVHVTRGYGTSVYLGESPIHALDRALAVGTATPRPDA